MVIFNKYIICNVETFTMFLHFYILGFSEKMVEHIEFISHKKSLQGNEKKFIFNKIMFVFIINWKVLINEPVSKTKR